LAQSLNAVPQGLINPNNFFSIKVTKFNQAFTRTRDKGSTNRENPVILAAMWARGAAEGAP
jgi:hypothetical protein